MTAVGSERSTKGNSLTRRAERLRQIGEIFLKLDPESDETGLVAGAFRMVWSEDALCAVPINPSPDQVELTEEIERDNARRRALPTSVENVTEWSVVKGEGEEGLKLVRYHHRADLNYKIPVMRIPDTGDPKGSLRTVAEVMSGWIKSRMDRIPEEKATDRLRKAVNTDILERSLTTLVMNPQSLEQGELEVIQHDLLTNLASRSEFDLNDPDSVGEDLEDLLLRTEFNLLSRLQSRRHELPDESPLIASIQALVDQFGK